MLITSQSGDGCNHGVDELVVLSTLAAIVVVPTVADIWNRTTTAFQEV